MKVKYPLFKELSIEPFIGDLSGVVEVLSGVQFSPVKTKHNKNGTWNAISLKGYGKDHGDILKPGVLKSDIEQKELVWTTLCESSEFDVVREIVDKIPAKTERVRVMRVEANTGISKHTDKVDKEIMRGELIRLHVPLKTSEDVKFHLWEGKEEKVFNMEMGKYYYVDVSKPHRVQNDSTFDRLHLVVDCYSNEELTNLVLG